MEKIPQALGKARDQAAKLVGTNPRYVSDAKKLSKEAPQLFEKVKAGELSLPAAKLKARDEANKAALTRPVTVEIAPGLHVGDFREKASLLADECCELVFTDPPYDRESIPLFEAAAKEAARILKPGGSFLAYCGQTQLPEVIAGISKHLRYWWCAAALDPGSQQRMERYGVICQWKPLLWFVKGTRGDVQTFVFDVVEGPREKTHHVWQQAEDEAAYYIEKLTSPHGLVVDFFAGGGTTLAAARRLSRPWIAFEIDPAAAARASQRLASEAA